MMAKLSLARQGRRESLVKILLNIRLDDRKRFIVESEGAAYRVADRRDFATQ